VQEFAEVSVVAQDGLERGGRAEVVEDLGGEGHLGRHGRLAVLHHRLPSRLASQTVGAPIARLSPSSSPGLSPMGDTHPTHGPGRKALPWCSLPQNLSDASSGKNNVEYFVRAVLDNRTAN